MSGSGRGEATWPSLGVVVPIYNEEATIEQSCRAIVDSVRRFPGHVVVIGIDDGSTDASAELVSRLASELEGLDLVRHDVNRGYGEALRTGVCRAMDLRLEYAAFIDSDLTNPPSDLLKIGELAQRGHPYMKASRFVPGGNMRAIPWSRRTISRLGNVVAARLFGTRVRDVTNGFRAGRTDLLCSWPTREPGFAVIVEEFAMALRSGIEPVEFPSSLSTRSGEQRRSAFSYSPSLIWSYLRHPLSYRIGRLRSRKRS